MGLRKSEHITNHHFYSSPLPGEGVALSYISSEWTTDRFYIDSNEVDFLEYKEDAVTAYEILNESFKNDEITSMDYARSEGVEREWEVYNFFAQDEINAPREVFQYIDNEGEEAFFTQEEIDMIRDWTPGESAPIQGIEGHHMELVSHNPGNLGLAADTNNILFATEKGHFDFLHGGHASQATQQEYFGLNSSIEEKFQATLDYNEILLGVNPLHHGLISIGGSTVLSTVIGVVVEGYRLRYDTRPWKYKQGQLLRSGISYGLFGAGLSSVGYISQMGVEGMLSGIDATLLTPNFVEVMGINGAFFSMSICSILLQYFWKIKKGENHGKAKMEAEHLMKVASIEMLAFSALGIGLDVIGDLAKDTVADALFPDPTGGLLILTRVSYSLFKAGKKVKESNDQKDAYEECRLIRYNNLYNNALDEIKS